MEYMGHQEFAYQMQFLENVIKKYFSKANIKVDGNSVFLNDELLFEIIPNEPYHHWEGPYLCAKDYLVKDIRNKTEQTWVKLDEAIFYVQVGLSKAIKNNV